MPVSYSVKILLATSLLLMPIAVFAQSGGGGGGGGGGGSAGGSSGGATGGVTAAPKAGSPGAGSTASQVLPIRPADSTPVTILVG
jgi:hypothetical protein